ncbi:2Fe-2S iron-sulfur cluster binding domain-containing protein [Sphingopyxis sp. OPL5]|uniref:2Fe-2S iron-sulfur cluster-binding protein n=1 Tax=Sphingopyxis sp. OPL5 TaxID=2486273 RepID=UPI00164E68F4|nr:2Fe-2S iron-sulfur cluster-binding protein [Sphingopyxis sp. OPL5]QNO28344.1 2Fe-2S iron-sulfur cluster binding domain-containing protein [Sphingopyxis sp. OPL5]
MVRVIFVEPDGTERNIEAEVGHSLMEAALRHGIDAIRADCGGGCSCATCHVHVDPPWRNRLPSLGETEDLMLEFVEGRDEHSRLSCQIDVSAELDGLTVKLSEEQR